MSEIVCHITTLLLFLFLFKAYLAITHAQLIKTILSLWYDNTSGSFMPNKRNFINGNFITKICKTF